MFLFLFCFVFIFWHLRSNIFYLSFHFIVNKMTIILAELVKVYWSLQMYQKNECNLIIFSVKCHAIYLFQCIVNKPQDLVRTGMSVLAFLFVRA